MPQTSGDVDPATLTFEYRGSVTIEFTSDAYVAKNGFVFMYTTGKRIAIVHPHLLIKEPLSLTLPQTVKGK